MTYECDERIFDSHRSCTTKYFCIQHSYASFDTFCVQSGQLFETQRVFEVCLKIDKLLSSKENVVDFGILPIIQRLTVPRIIDQFGPKMCQKKRKEGGYKLL